MYAKKLIVICGALIIVSSENEHQSRNGRFLTFNSLDNDELKINLEFAIPFISIQTKKTLDSAFGLWPSELPTININPASMALGGAVVLGTTVLLPLLIKSFTHHYPEQRYSRLLSNAEFSTDAVLDFASQMLSNSQAVRGCALRIACWTAQRSTKTDTKRIWSHLMSNALLSSMINSTAIEDAMMSGRLQRDCLTYSPCPLREQHIPMVMNNLAVLSNSISSY